jgi:hypothetical protein
VVYAPITVPGHTNDLAITIGYSDDATGELLEADIIVNSRQSFALLDGERIDGAPSCTDDPHGACGDAYDLQSIVTHEAGHFFGLGEDRTDRLATMFECSSPCETHKRDLDSGDARAIGALYSDSEPLSGETAAGCSMGRDAPRGLALWTGIVVLLVGSSRRRTRWKVPHMRAISQLLRIKPNPFAQVS